MQIKTLWTLILSPVLMSSVLFSTSACAMMDKEEESEKVKLIKKVVEECVWTEATGCWEKCWWGKGWTTHVDYDGVEFYTYKGEKEGGKRYVTYDEGKWKNDKWEPKLVRVSEDIPQCRRCRERVKN